MNEQAEESGVSSTTWLRTLVQTAHRRERITARVVWRKTFLKSQLNKVDWVRSPNLSLEPIWDMPGPSLSFWVRAPTGQGYADWRWLKGLPFIRNRDEVLFLLDDSPSVWACEWLRGNPHGRSAICLTIDKRADAAALKR